MQPCCAHLGQCDPLGAELAGRARNRRARNRRARNRRARKNAPRLCRATFGAWRPVRAKNWVFGAICSPRPVYLVSSSLQTFGFRSIGRGGASLCPSACAIRPAGAGRLCSAGGAFSHLTSFGSFGTCLSPLSLNWARVKACGEGRRKWKTGRFLQNSAEIAILYRNAVFSIVFYTIGPHVLAKRFWKTAAAAAEREPMRNPRKNENS